MSKVLCPAHKDTVPSMHDYGTHQHCYVCGYHSKGSNSHVMQNKNLPRRVDLNKALERISRLPRRLIRGFMLPYDANGYYLVYPNTKFYLYRRSETEPRYSYPSGHKVPLFLATKSKNNTLVIVEGQFNALTAAQAGFNVTVVSPGSALKMATGEHLDYYLQYKDICLIVDKDAPGVAAAVTLRDKLTSKGANVVIRALEEDLNDSYVKEGEAKVKEILKEALAVFRVQECLQSNVQAFTSRDASGRG